MTLEVNQEYQWNRGFGTTLDINKVVSELKAIQEEKGEILPEDVVAAAKSKTSALHDYFVWDNKLAAHKYRLHQASALIRRIEIKVIQDGEPKTFRAFELVSKQPQEQGNYVSFDRLDNAEVAKQIVINDLKRSINRLSPFNEFVEVVHLLSDAMNLLKEESTETVKQVSPAEPVEA